MAGYTIQDFLRDRGNQQDATDQNIRDLPFAIGTAAYKGGKWFRELTEKMHKGLGPSIARGAGALRDVEFGGDKTSEALAQGAPLGALADIVRRPEARDRVAQWYKDERARKGEVTVPDLAAVFPGETPSEWAMNAFGLPGKAAKLAAGAAATTYSPDTDAIVPGSRRAMLTLRQQLLREGMAGEGAATRAGEIDPEQARAVVSQVQREIDPGQIARRRGKMEGPDYSGYTLFDYRRLGQDPDAIQYSRLRPQPTGNRFEALPDRIQDMVSDPYVYRHMRAAAQRGEPFWNWYDIRQWRDALMNQGMSKPEYARWMEHQKAAAQMLGPEQQFKLGNYLWHADKSGLLVPGAPPIQLPPGYGAVSQKNIVKSAQDIAQNFAGQMPDLERGVIGGIVDTEKLGPYGQNLLGNLSQLAPDKHMIRQPQMLRGDPRNLVSTLRVGVNPTRMQELEGMSNVRLDPSGKYVSWSPRQSWIEGRLPMAQALREPTMWTDSIKPDSLAGALEQYLYNPIAREIGAPLGAAQAGGWFGLGELTGLRTENKMMLQLIEDGVKDMMQRHGLSFPQALDAIRQGIKY